MYLVDIWENLKNSEKDEKNQQNDPLDRIKLTFRRKNSNSN